MKTINVRAKLLYLLLIISLNGISQTPELIFHSGFEPMTTGTIGDNDIIGIDNSVLPPNDWVIDLDGHPNIGDFYFFYEGGNDTMRYAKIVQDPTNPSNKVLHYWLKYANVSGLDKGRVEANLWYNNNLHNLSQKVRIFLPDDWNILKNANGGIVDWMTIAEYWNNAGPWSGEGYPFRISLSIYKEDPYSTDLTFNVTADIKTTYWQAIWEESDTTFSIPVGQWITLETYYKEGNQTNGRFVLAVTPDGGSRQIIFDITNFTHHPNDSSPDGLGHYNPMKLYSSKPIIDYVRNNGGILQLYWDDFEIWKDTNIVLNLSENESSAIFKLFPNPTSDYSILEFNNPTNESHTLKLYDVQGRVVRTITDIKSNQVIIEKNHLINGLYFFQLSTNKKISLTGKLILE